jgi:hypothetical protein
MKFVSQLAIAGVLSAGACAVPVDILPEVLILSPDGGEAVGGTGAIGLGGSGSGGTGLSGASGSGGSAPLGGSAGSGGTGFTQGGAGGAAGMGGAGAGAGGAAAAMGGAGGTGVGGAGVEPPPDNCVETGSVGGFNVEVIYAETSEQNQIGMRLAIRSTGATFNMNQLRVRYWFTPGTTQAFQFTCDSAQLQNPFVDIQDNVNVTFDDNTISAFAEITIDRPDPIGVGIDTIQLRMYTAMFTNLVHTDDFSYVDGAVFPNPNPNISAYVGNDQVFGCEPPDP